MINQSDFYDVSDLSADLSQGAVEVAQEAHHYANFYDNPEFWVGLAFVVVVLLLVKPIRKVGSSLLNKRIDAIAKRINDAQKLKDDAQKLWVEYEKKYLNVQNEAFEIISKSEKEISFMKSERLKKLNEEISRRESEALALIQTAEKKVLVDIQKNSTELSIKAVKNVLSKSLDEKTQDDLIEKSITLLKKVS